MIRVVRLTYGILALTLAGVLLMPMAAGQQAPSAVQPSLTLKDAPVQDVIRMLARAQGMDLLMTDDVQGNISLEVEQKTPEEVFDLICAAKNLYWWKERGVYVVSATPRSAGAEPKPAEETPLPETLRANDKQLVIQLQFAKSQDLAYLFGGAPEPYTDAYRTIRQVTFPYGEPGQQVGHRVGVTSEPAAAKARTAAAVSGNPFEELSQVTVPGVIEPAPAAPAAIPGEELAEGEISSQAPLVHLLPEGLTAPVAFAPLNALIVQGPPEAIEEFRKLVEMLDVRVPQVMVEAQFVEMRVEDARQFGIDWSWIGGETSVDVTGITGGGPVGVSFTKGKFSALLQALLTSQRARVINAPRLATMNNQPVSFTISTTYFYFTTDVIRDLVPFGGTATTTTSVLNALPVVTTFTILPQVNGDNSITVDVTTIISDVVGIITGPGGEQVPQPTATTLPTRLRVENGETIVIGEFIRKEVGRIQGSYLHINLHLEIAEVFEVLARMRAIPPELLEPVLAESRAACEEGEPASYIRVEAHIRLSEVAPLLAAITGRHQVRVEAEPQAFEVEPQPAPSEGPPPNE